MSHDVFEGPRETGQMRDWFSGRNVGTIFLIGLSVLLITLLPRPFEVGLFVSVASLLLATAFALYQGRQLKRLSRSIYRVAFNEVTLKVFGYIQTNEKLSQRMREGQLEVKAKIGESLRAIKFQGGSSNLFRELCVERPMFLESGSTYAYLAVRISEFHNERGVSNAPQRVLTNNLLAYMVLLFQKQCRASLYPGTPIDKYGATYGEAYDPPTNLSTSQDEMDNFLDLPQSEWRQDDQPVPAVDLVFMAISRISLKYGPHVGSQENANFKRQLKSYALERRLPIVMVVDHSKIEDEESAPVPGSCYALYPVGVAGAPPSESRAGDFDPRGFELFLEDLARGLFLLIVAFEERREPQLITRFKARAQDLVDDRLAFKLHVNGSVTLLTVYASGTPTSGGQLALDIQRWLQSS